MHKLRFAGQWRWVLIFWIFLVSATSYLDRVNISIAGTAVQKDFGLSNVQLGWVFSAFLIGYALFQIPGGRLADHFGPRLVITIAVLWWSAFSVLTALVPPNLGVSVWLLIAVRFLLGSGEAVVYPSANRMVVSWIPTAERGAANGLIFAGVGVGAGITPPLITFSLIHWGWHWSFYISGLIGLAAALGWLVLARDTPGAHPWIGHQERETIEQSIPVPANGPELRRGTSWRKILANRQILLLTSSYFCYAYCSWIFFSWFFIYLSKVRGLALEASSYYSMLPFCAIAVSSPIGGWLGDLITKRAGKRAGRCGVAAFALAAAACLIVLATQVKSARLATVVLACAVGSQYLAQSSYWAVTADIAGTSAGVASGLMNMGAQIGASVTSVLTPMIAGGFGWTASFLVAAGMCALAGIAWLVVNPNVQLDTDADSHWERRSVPASSKHS